MWHIPLGDLFHCRSLSWVMRVIHILLRGNSFHCPDTLIPRRTQERVREHMTSTNSQAAVVPYRSDRNQHHLKILNANFTLYTCFQVIWCRVRQMEMTFKDCHLKGMLIDIDVHQQCPMNSLRVIVSDWLTVCLHAINMWLDWIIT